MLQYTDECHAVKLDVLKQMEHADAPLLLFTSSYLSCCHLSRLVDAARVGVISSGAVHHSTAVFRHGLSIKHERILRQGPGKQAVITIEVGAVEALTCLIACSPSMTMTEC